MPKLLIQLPDGEERIVPLPGGETLTVGRDDHHAVTLDERTVSRLHARLIWREDGAYLLEDLQSANGTTLNNAPLAGPEPLQDGDRLSFGEVAAIYLAADATRPPARKFTVGDLFAGRYRLEGFLGETDEYDTFCAADMAARAALVAITIFIPETIAGAGGFDDVRRQFARVRAVPPHPRLVRLLDFARWRGNEYLASEWIEGRTLLDLLRRRGAIPLVGALRLADQVAAATDHARAHGLPAPDLAPRAVLLSSGEPLPAAAWEEMLDAPAERWPAFALKIIPRLFAPAVKTPWPLGTLLCDVLGHPPTGLGMPPPARIACLGEQGNMILARGFASRREPVGSDASFVAELADAVGVSAKRAPELNGGQSLGGFGGEAARGGGHGCCPTYRKTHDPGCFLHDSKGAWQVKAGVKLAMLRQVLRSRQNFLTSQNQGKE